MKVKVEFPGGETEECEFLGLIQDDREGMMAVLRTKDNMMLRTAHPSRVSFPTREEPLGWQDR